MKKLIHIIYCFMILISIVACSKQPEDDTTLNIVTTNFPGYDFSRAIVGNNDTITMLLKPGQESHDYDPSPQDIVKIKEADIFIYTGGESDSWVDTMLKTIDNENLICIRMMDYVDLYQEETIEGMQEEKKEEESEYDEHIWTSPINAIKLVEAIEKQLIKIDSDSTSSYQKNANAYIEELKDIDSNIKEAITNGKRKELIFGDRFPFRYFVETYGLTYYAAFPGCSSETEANAKTISFLIDKVKEDAIPVIFHTELSNINIAKTISKETNARVRTFHSVHNVTEADFSSGKTYIDFMKENIKYLKEALQ